MEHVSSFAGYGLVDVVVDYMQHICMQRCHNHRRYQYHSIA